MPTAVIAAAGPDAPERRAWAEVARDHYAGVYRVAYRLTGNSADAEDLAQETFFRVFRAWDSYRPQGSFEGWIYRIARNLFLDAKRREARIRLEALGDEAACLADPAQTPDAVVDLMTLDQRLEDALSQLSPDLRKALMMCDVEGKSYQEIADALGVRLGTVRSRLHRARAQARCALAS
jgi:RNA polymerase sigma-70 factor (ECF subfamily)